MSCILYKQTPSPLGVNGLGLNDFGFYGQQYDPDPAAKAAAASILASKLGAESGLKLALAAGLTNKEELAAQGKSVGSASERTAPVKGREQEAVDSVGLRNRKSQRRRDSVGQAESSGMSRLEGIEQNIPGGPGALEVWDEQGMDVRPPRNKASDGGWVARLAAMLVGEDPSQCYALICSKCHAHNGKSTHFNLNFFLQILINHIVFLSIYEGVLFLF